MVNKEYFGYRMAKYPAIRIALLLIIGIILASRFSLTTPFGLVFVISTFAVYLLFEIYSDKKLNPTTRNIGILFYLLFIIAIGFFRMQVTLDKEMSLAEKMINIHPWQEVEITGQIEDVIVNDKGKVRLNLNTQGVEIHGIGKTKTNFKTRVLWDLSRKVNLGDNLTLKGTIIPISEQRNPHSFDYEKYLARLNIHTQIKAEKVLEKSSDISIISWLGLRKEILKLIDNNFDSESAPIAKALLLGYKNELETETKTAFARSGLSHIMAVSGLHVGLIVAPFWFIIPYFWTRRYGEHLGLVLLIIVLFFYAGITGFSPSVMRASLMAVALAYGRLFSKAGESINLMGVAAIIILLINPAQLFDISFQLSFAAVLVILLLMPIMQRTLPYVLRIKWYGAPIMVMIISLVVQFGLYPFQVYYFGEVSVISPIANALFVPFLGVIVPLALLAVLIAVFSPTLAVILNFPANLFLKGLNSFVLYVGTLNWAWVKASMPSFLLFFFWMSMVFTISAWNKHSIRWKWVIVTLFSIVLLQLEGIYNTIKPANLEITIFDVGQGDANLIRTPNDKYILIDTGVWSMSSNSGEQILLPYFNNIGVDKLDAVILTHPHADHIGGIETLIENMEIDVIYDSGYEYDSSLYHNYLKKAEEHNIPVEIVSEGMVLDLDPALFFMVLGPDTEEHSSDPNQHSIIINMVHGNNRFLFTGDAGRPQENVLIKQYGELLDVDFLKVGHHGSRTSSDSLFLEYVSPKIATISLGYQNKFKHPHKEAIRRLQNTNADIYFTSRDKGLVFISDGENIIRKKWD